MQKKTKQNQNQNREETSSGQPNSERSDAKLASS